MAKTTQQRFDEVLVFSGIDPSEVNEDLYFDALDAYGEGGVSSASQRLGRELKVKSVTELIGDIATKGTVGNKVINKNMNTGYADNKTTLPSGLNEWSNALTNVDDNTPYETPRKIAFEKLKPITPEQLQQQVIESAVVDKAATEVAQDVADVEDIVNADPGKGNVNNWKYHVNTIKDDILSGGLTSAAIGGSSIALSQMQGRELPGTALNLAGALGGSMLGNKYLGTIGSTPARALGGLAGHTITNLLTNIFRNPKEQQLLDQGMQYQNQQSIN